MKKTAAALLSALLAAIFCISGCGNTAGESKETTSRLDSLLESAADNIRILYDITAVAAPKEASFYLAEWYSPETELIKEKLLKGKVLSETLYAEGMQYITEEESEYLTLYDRSGMRNGGFSYILSGQNGVRIPDYQNVVNLNPGHPDLTEQRHGYRKSEDFALSGDFEFMSAEAAAGQVSGLLSELGVPAFSVKSVLALDRDTLNAHEKLRVSQSEEKVWKKEDEAYLIWFSQVIDDIPLIDHAWTGQRIQATEVTMSALLSPKGLLKLNIENMVTPVREEKKESLLSPQEAERLMLEKYTPAAAAVKICAEKMELAYVGVTCEEGIKLIPAWVFCIGRELTDYNDGERNYTGLYEYEHFVVNAATGEEIITMNEELK